MIAADVSVSAVDTHASSTAVHTNEGEEGGVCTSVWGSVLKSCIP